MSPTETKFLLSKSLFIAKTLFSSSSSDTLQHLACTCDISYRLVDFQNALIETKGFNEQLTKKLPLVSGWGMHSYGEEYLPVELSWIKQEASLFCRWISSHNSMVLVSRCFSGFLFWSWAKSQSFVRKESSNESFTDVSNTLRS